MCKFILSADEGGLLGGEEVEPFLVGQPLPGVLVLRGEPGGVRAEGRGPGRINLNKTNHKNFFRLSAPLRIILDEIGNINNK